jgi:hypothetical protein
MTNFNLVQIKMEFDFSQVNDRIMSVCLCYNNRETILSPSCPGTYSMSVDIQLPAQIKLNFSGKNNQVDTILDKHQNIVKDLYIQVKKIYIDNIESKANLDKMLCFTTASNEKIITSYIGFNSSMILDLTENNAFEQLMTWSRLYS